MKSKGCFFSVRYFFILLFPLAFMSCQKWDVKSVDVENYHPEVAFPIGKYEVSVDDFINGVRLVAVDPDTIDDDIPLMYYNFKYYPVASASFDTTIKVNYDWDIEQEMLDAITKLVFRSNFINYSTTSVAYQVYFFNNTDVLPFDQLFIAGPQVINPGTVKADGTIESIEYLNRDQVFENQRLDDLKELSRIEIAVRISYKAEKGQITRYETNDFMWIQIGSRLSFDIDVEQF